MEKNNFEERASIEKNDKDCSSPEQLFQSTVMSLFEKNQDSVDKSIMLQMLEDLKTDINGNVKKR